MLYDLLNKFQNTEAGIQALMIVCTTTVLCVALRCLQAVLTAAFTRRS